MKKYIVLAFMSVALITCAKKTPLPKIVQGVCANTQVFFAFLDENGDVKGIAPAPAGCRCSVSIDGKEFVATLPEEDSAKCQKTEAVPPETN